LVCSVQIDAVVWTENLEWPLNTSIVDQAVQLRVFGENIFDEV